VAALPEGASPVIDGGEAVDGAWVTAAEGCRRAMEGTLKLAPPTLRTLYELLPYRTVAEVQTAPRSFPVICPRFVQADGGDVFVLLPGDPEHPSAEAVDPPYRYRFDVGRWWAADGPFAGRGQG
jgi:hypothetical protein